MEHTLESEPGVVARKLTSLLSQLSNRHLDVAKAFGREDDLSYIDLVSQCDVAPGNSRCNG